MSERHEVTSAPGVGARKTTLAALRLATRPAHARLDAGLLVARPSVTPVEYAGYLRAMLDVVGPVEARWRALPGWRDVLPDADERWKAPALERDLAALGAALDDATLAGGTLATATLAEALGVAYVLEGSTLGGAVIARHVEATLGPATPMAYLRIYGATLGARWTTFTGALERAVPPSEVDAACASACATFEAVERALRARGVVG